GAGVVGEGVGRDRGDGEGAVEGGGAEAGHGDRVAHFVTVRRLGGQGRGAGAEDDSRDDGGGAVDLGVAELQRLAGGGFQADAAGAAERDVGADVEGQTGQRAVGDDQARRHEV